MRQRHVFKRFVRDSFRFHCSRTRLLHWLTWSLSIQPLETCRQPFNILTMKVKMCLFVVLCQHLTRVWHYSSMMILYERISCRTFLFEIIEKLLLVTNNDRTEEEEEFLRWSSVAWIYQAASATPFASGNLFPRTRAQSTIHQAKANRLKNVITPRAWVFIAVEFSTSRVK